MWWTFSQSYMYYRLGIILQLNFVSVRQCSMSIEDRNYFFDCLYFPHNVGDLVFCLIWLFSCCQRLPGRSSSLVGLRRFVSSEWLMSITHNGGQQVLFAFRCHFQIASSCCFYWLIILSLQRYDFFWESSGLLGQCLEIVLIHQVCIGSCVKFKC